MKTQFGFLAQEYCGMDIPVKVLRSAAGYYIGTFDNSEGPISRESVEYYPTYDATEQAMVDGTWTQRRHP
jgi:hypothetical protein